jgi:hypothetical protein
MQPSGCKPSYDNEPAKTIEYPCLRFKDPHLCCTGCTTNEWWSGKDKECLAKLKICPFLPSKQRQLSTVMMLCQRGASGAQDGSGNSGSPRLRTLLRCVRPNSKNACTKYVSGEYTRWSISWLVTFKEVGRSGVMHHAPVESKIVGTKFVPTPAPNRTTHSSSMALRLASKTPRHS